jgi:hypothetical protein
VAGGNAIRVVVLQTGVHVLLLGSVGQRVVVESIRHPVALLIRCATASSCGSMTSSRFGAFSSSGWDLAILLCG